MDVFVKPLIVALSMYSQIPVPHLQWSRKNMQFALLYLPFVGIVVAALLAAAFWFFHFFSLSGVFFASAAVFLPLIITGGIHDDGFCDTCDAIFSHADLQKKLEIMKDPHVGAFGPLYTGAILLVQFGAWHQIFTKSGLLLAALSGFVVSRAFGALAIICFPKAKESGLAVTFSGFTAKRPSICALTLVILIVSALAVLFSGWLAIIIPAALAVVFVIFYRIASEQFGGVTGDLAGFYITIAETTALILSALLGAIFL